MNTGSKSMQRTLGALSVSVALSLAAIGGAVHAAEQASPHPEFLAVLSAHSGASNASTVTLRGVPGVVQFSDRPFRITEHTTVAEFVDLWDVGANSFAVDPPNAVLSILGDGDPSNVVIELTSIQYVEGELRFGYELLDGDPIPAAFGPVSLFIDGGCQGALKCKDI